MIVGTLLGTHIDAMCTSLHALRLNVAVVGCFSMYSLACEGRQCDNQDVMLFNALPTVLKCNDYNCVSIKAVFGSVYEASSSPEVSPFRPCPTKQARRAPTGSLQPAGKTKAVHLVK